MGRGSSDIRRVNQTWRHLLETIDRPVLKPLPAEPDVVAEPAVGSDYHVEVDNHFYSIPHRYVRAEVDARFTTRTVAVFQRGERIDTHRRGSGDGKHTTIPDHMPPSHRRYADLTIERISREADAIGPSVSILCTLISERRPHPEQGFRALSWDLAAGAFSDGRPLGRGRRARHRDRRADLWLGKIPSTTSSINS